MEAAVTALIAIVASIFSAFAMQVKHTERITSHGEDIKALKLVMAAIQKDAITDKDLVAMRSEISSMKELLQEVRDEIRILIRK